MARPRSIRQNEIVEHSWRPTAAGANYCPVPKSRQTSRPLKGVTGEQLILPDPAPLPLLDLRLEFNAVERLAQFTWTYPFLGRRRAVGRVRCTGLEKVIWELEANGKTEIRVSSPRLEDVRVELGRWIQSFPTNQNTFLAFWIKPHPGSGKPQSVAQPPFAPGQSPYPWIEDSVMAMVEVLRLQFSPVARLLDEGAFEFGADYARVERRLQRKEQKQAEEEARRRETMARLAEQRRRKEQQAEARRAAQVRKADPAKSFPAAPPALTRPPLPPVPIHLQLPPLALQETAFPLAALDGYWLRERAALWWVSNQSDDLLCLPHCRIERLDYQIRTALRVLGPLRGRALLSDEVGLGKTIEAGLVIKELLTRGMVKRFLVLTVPSLVDQWEEELNDKFGLATATTNHAAARGDAREILARQPRHRRQPAHPQTAGPPGDRPAGALGHAGRGRGALPAQPRLAGLAGGQCPAAPVPAPAHAPLRCRIRSKNSTTSSPCSSPASCPRPRNSAPASWTPNARASPASRRNCAALLGQVMIRNTRANAGLQLPAAPRRDGALRAGEAERPSGSNGRPNCAPAWPSSTPARPVSGAVCCCKPPAAARQPGARRWKSFPTRAPRAPGANRRRWKTAGGANAT